jgi:hypothetical protein
MTLSSYLKWIYKTSTSIACGIEWNNLNNAYFRGHADKKWELKPSLFRNNNLIYEHELFKKAQNTLWFELQNTKTHLERLIILQHHGLSTRLLDVTTNPLIALYFACLDNKNDKGEETDGVVYCSYYNDGSFNNNNIEKICEFINEKQPDEICSTLPKIVLKEEVNEDLLTKSHFILPPYNNKRIIAQGGAFLLPPLYEKSGTKWCLNSQPLKTKDCFPKKKIIPANDKKTLLNELMRYGIHEGTLFPDMEHKIAHIQKTIK